MTHLTEIQLNEYLDNVLDASTRRAAESHLRSCEDCRSRLDELQSLFADLSALPEARLPRDLTAAVLRRLPPRGPRPWTPAFAAQLGAALGASLWLSVQVAKFAPPLSAAFRLPRPGLPAVTLSLPTFDLQLLALDFLRFAISIFRPAIHDLRFALLESPRLQIPLPDLRFDTLGGLSGPRFVSMIVSVCLLWIIGNVSLLRGRSEVGS